MSGGSFDYMYSRIEDTYVGFMEDEDLNELMKDLCEVLHDLEWYKSCDVGEKDYKESVNKFKDKWFGKRDINLRRQLANKVKKLLDALDEKEVK